jgi:hypothetical protein
VTVEESVPAETAEAIAVFNALTVLAEVGAKTNVPPVLESVIVVTEPAAMTVPAVMEAWVEVKLDGALLANTFWPLKLVDWPI